MVSGKPLSKEEKKCIELMRSEKFPSIIARHLTIHYSQYNNGSRSTRCVQEYIRHLDEMARAPPPTPKKTRSRAPKPAPAE
jgi:hypothetical protein